MIGNEGSGAGDLSECVFRPANDMTPDGSLCVLPNGGGGLAGKEGCRSAGIAVAVDVDASDDGLLLSSCLSFASIIAILSSVRLPVRQNDM